MALEIDVMNMGSERILKFKCLRFGLFKSKLNWFQYLNILLIIITNAACSQSKIQTEDQKQSQDLSQDHVQNINQKQQGEILEIGNHAETDSLTLTTLTVKSPIEGVDSLMEVFSGGKEIFKIALGGNVELLRRDYILEDSVKVEVLTLADYFQNDQIFYVISIPSERACYQTERLYLPNTGLEIKDFAKLDSYHWLGDFLKVTSNELPDIRVSLVVDTLQTDDNGIINYYEFN